MTRMLYGAFWHREIMGPVCRNCKHRSCGMIRNSLLIDELGHRRQQQHVPCFVGGSQHSMRELGNDIQHCVLRLLLVCVYCGHCTTKAPKDEVLLAT